MSDNHNFSIQGYNLVTLLKRLEAATSRLEDVTIYQEKHTPAASAASAAVLPASAPAAIEDKPATETKAVELPNPVTELPNSIKDFDAFIESSVEPYVKLSNDIDSILGEQANAFREAILKERNILFAAANSGKIGVEDVKFQELVIAPINELIMKVIKAKDDNRSNSRFFFLNAVAEGVPVLGWIVTNTPVSYIPDFKDSAQFWTNRILKDCKGKDDEQVNSEWVKTFLKIFEDLKNYVKEYQTTGIAWKGTGDFVSELSKVNGSATDIPVPPAPSAGGAPPPPPPPPPPPADLFADVIENKGATKSEGVGMGAVFAELNKGENITSGLKKVDKSEMTHKNPELRKKAVPMPPKKPKNLSSGGAKEVETKKKEGRVELVDNKWMVTNMTKAEVVDNKDGMIVIEGSMDQSVYIGQSEGIVVQIKGKVNAISMNLCEKVGIIIDKAISSVEVTKCKKSEIQVIDNVPIMNVDQSESINVYLSESSLGMELYSSCCQALNVNIPGGEKEEAGDLKEVAVSEQFVTRFAPGGKHTTEAVRFS